MTLLFSSCDKPQSIPRQRYGQKPVKRSRHTKKEKNIHGIMCSNQTSRASTKPGGFGHCEQFAATSISPVHVNRWAAADLRLVTDGGTVWCFGLENIHFGWASFSFHFPFGHRNIVISVTGFGVRHLIPSRCCSSNCVSPEAGWVYTTWGHLNSRFVSPIIKNTTKDLFSPTRLY